MSADRPLVSVIMPTFNAAPFVAESIESVFAQTSDPIELLVVDDASEDDTPEIAEEYAGATPSRCASAAGRSVSGRAAGATMPWISPAAP